jgi:Tfp pilus assembly protein PilX
MGTRKCSAVLYNNKGSALIVSLIILVVLLLIGAAALKVAGIETLIAGNDVAGKQAFQAAEGASEYEAMQLRTLLNTSLSWKVPDATINSSISAPSISGFTIQETSPIAVVLGSQQTKTVVGQNYPGLTAWCQSFTITTTAKDNSGRAKATIVRLVEDQLIPLFQFAVFYNGSLEVVPGANMDIAGTNGRIHSNSDIYLAADGSATLTIDDRITTPGKLHHGTLDGRTLTTQPVVITDGLGGHPQLNLDSITDPNWETDATATWHGNVQTDVHGILPLNVPIPGITPGANGYIEMIEQGPSSDSYRFSNEASLKIIDGAATDKNGTTVTLSSCGGGNPLSTTTFFDKRENRTVTVRQVDIAKLQNCTSAKNALNNPPAGDDPGILYVHETTSPGIDSSKGVRLVNGSDLTLNNALPSGLMVATDNPLYIKGDYNTSNSRPAALAADAVTILSNAWTTTSDSTYSHDSNLNNRVASNTTVNAAIMGGNVTTLGSQYSGGLENFPRFLEDWTNKNFTYGGSLVCLWQSQRATGRWVYGSPIYAAPNRIWSYNMNVNSMPPGTPRVRNLQRIQWYQVRN